MNPNFDVDAATRAYLALLAGPARQRALSPVFNAASPNTPSFLILHVEREDGTAQAAELADALRKAGTAVEVQGFAGSGLRGHMEMNRALGRADYPATATVDAWLARVLPAR